MVWSSVRIFVVALFIVAALPRVARAGGERAYAVVAMEVSGDADPTLRAQVAAGLARGVEETGGVVIGYDEVQKRLAPKPALIGCTSTTCLASIAEVVGTADMIRVRIAAQGANYEVELELLGVNGPIRKRSGSCTVCTISDLADLTATRVHELLEAEVLPIAIVIAVEPADATLEIPGVGTQPAPWSGELAPGSYEITARRDGFVAKTETVIVSDDGSDHQFKIALGPVDAGGADGGNLFTRGKWSWKKWAIGGGGAVALITGIALLAVDGNSTCDASGVTCPREYDTSTAGLLIGLVGLGGAGVSGWMFWSERQDRQETATVVPTQGGAVAAFSWRW